MAAIWLWPSLLTSLAGSVAPRVLAQRDTVAAANEAPELIVVEKNGRVDAVADPRTLDQQVKISLDHGEAKVAAVQHQMKEGQKEETAEKKVQKKLADMIQQLREVQGQHELEQKTQHEVQTWRSKAKLIRPKVQVQTAFMKPVGGVVWSRNKQLGKPTKKGRKNVAFRDVVAEKTVQRIFEKFMERVRRGGNKVR